MTGKGPSRLDTEIHCKPLHVRISIEKCLDAFVEANAFSNQASACFKCPQGELVRNLVAGN